MLAQTFEIKVALLGNVSAGKTTVLNALFREKFSEVAMKRTTVGANFFRLHTKQEIVSGTDSSSKSTGEQTSKSATQEWFKVPDEPRTAESILKEITNDNRRLRASTSDAVNEKHFDIEIEDELVPMAKNTKLVFIDIPGINEAGTDNKYKDYVSKNWYLFDCVILVIDGKRDVRTDDQIYILKLVKENLKKRDIPIIVLCNKVDYKTEEQEELVRIAQEEVNVIFVGSSLSAAKSITVKKKYPKISTPLGRPPAFISVSAMQAYFYRLAPRMTLEKFKKTVDMTLIEEFGGALVGRVHWRKLTNTAKVQRVFDIVTDPDNCKQGIDDSKFELFLQTLSNVLGGEAVQRDLIMDQVNSALKLLESGNEPGMASQLKTAYEKSRLLHAGQEDLSSSTNRLRQTFWKVYQKLENSLFAEFDENWKEQKVSLLVRLMDELISYHNLCSEANWDDEKEIVQRTMQGIIRRQIHVITTKEQGDLDVCRERIWFEKSGAFSPFDWNIIKGSILLLSNEKHFIEAFGREKLMLESTYPSWQLVPSLESYKICRICGSYVYCGNCNSNCHGHCNSNYYGSNYKPACTCCRVSFGSNYENDKCPRCNTSLKCGDACTHCRNKVEYYGFDVRMSFDLTTKTMLPRDPTSYSKYVHVKVPNHLSDPNHIGHIAWKYCQFMRKLEH